MGILSEAIETGRTYFSKGYPPFIYSSGASGSQLPAFFYHDVSAAEFESHIAYLADNGYTTLSCDAAVSALRSPSLRNSKHVLLTFDDGLVSLYREIFPLVVRHQIHIVAYIVPAWVGQPGFVTWQECREMQSSGWVDLQSHSHAHAKVVTDARLQGWWCAQGPDSRPWGVAGFEPGWFPRHFQSLPNLRGDSLFAGKPMIVFPEAFWDQCSRISSIASERERERAFAKIRSEYTPAAVTLREVAPQMSEDIKKSKVAIESEVPGQVVRHFAFPWHVNSPAAWKAVEAAGFASAAIGLANTDKSPADATSVTKIVRVNGDFLPCLPGRDRKHFLRVLVRKATRRLNRGASYGVAD